VEVGNCFSVRGRKPSKKREEKGNNIWGEWGKKASTRAKRGERGPRVMDINITEKLIGGEWKRGSSFSAPRWGTIFAKRRSQLL